MTAHKTHKRSILNFPLLFVFQHIQIRLLVCSVDKAKEMGIDWWSTNSYLSSGAADKSRVEAMSARIAQLEAAAQQPQPMAMQAEGAVRS